MSELNIRSAEIWDAQELLDIYRPYVENTAISFEYDVPDIEEFRHRMENILLKYPYLVAVHESEIVGYAYASTFKDRKAYDWSVETTIYMKESMKGKGHGKILYLALEEELQKRNILNANACIAVTEKEDPYLTNESMQFHERMGYKAVGTFHYSGKKFGIWYHMMWMEKMLGEHIKM